MLDFVFDASFLASIPRFVTPILLAALGGAICERAGVFNIGLEGMMLTGAFFAVVGAYFAGSPYVGALLAALSPAWRWALIFAEFNLRRGGDSIVVSIAINLLAAGADHLPAARASSMSTGAFNDPAIAGFEPIHIPVVAGSFRSSGRCSAASRRCSTWRSCRRLCCTSSSRAIGSACASARPARTRQALTAGGVNPNQVRLIALLMCGALCGLAGAQLSIANVNLFVENMSAGRGWIAVVAVLLTRGRPWPLFFITLLFGTVDSLSFRVQGLGLPQQFTDMMPYLATLVVLTALSWWRMGRRTGTMTDLVIRNAIVVTCDAAGTVIDEGGVAVERRPHHGHRLIGASSTPHVQKAKKVIDGSGHILMPGIVNTHCHAADSLFRGLVENLPLEPWLQTVWKAEGAILNPRHVATRQRARLRRTAALRRHHRHGHVLVSVRDGAGGARRSACASRPAASSSIRPA